MLVVDGRRSSEYESGFGRVVRRLSERRARSRSTSNAHTLRPENSYEQRQASEELPQSVPMERSYAQSGWQHLKRQLSKGSMVKRKRSATDACGQPNNIETTAAANLKVKRVTLTDPPPFTASDYAQSLENLRPTVEQQRHQLRQAGPSTTQQIEDVQMFDGAEVFSSQPTLDKIYTLYNRAPSEERQDSYAQVSPRTITSNDAALKALEGNAPHDDGSSWQLNNRERREMAQRLHLSKAHLGANASRARPQEAPVVSADEPDLFSPRQQRRISRYIEVAETSDGFECEMEE